MSTVCKECACYCDKQITCLSIHKLSFTQPFLTQVNGFEVYDTEEAILYFLEQDPEIVLSVARPIQKVIK